MPTVPACLSPVLGFEKGSGCQMKHFGGTASWQRWEGIAIADDPMYRMIYSEGGNVIGMAVDLGNPGQECVSES